MQLEGLIDGRKMVEAVAADRPYGEAQVYFAKGANPGGHQAAACRERAEFRLRAAKIREFFIRLT
jgi:hypothetical protein